MVAQQRVGYGFDVPRKRGESKFTTSWDPCNMYIPDRCLAQVKSCVVAKSTALLTKLQTILKALSHFHKGRGFLKDVSHRPGGAQVRSAPSSAMAVIARAALVEM